MDEKRFRRALNQDINIVASFDDSVFKVNGHRGIDYLVNVDLPSCTCPDWQKHEWEGGCKHLIAVKLGGDGDSTEAVTQSNPRQNRRRERGEVSYPDDWEHWRRTVCKRDNWTCMSCGTQSGPDGDIELHAHHMTPVAEGGSHDLENLITLCRECYEELHGQPIKGPPSRVSSTPTSPSNSEPIPPSETHSSPLAKESSEDPKRRELADNAPWGPGSSNPEIGSRRNQADEDHNYEDEFRIHPTKGELNIARPEDEVNVSDTDSVTSHKEVNKSTRSRRERSYTDKSRDEDGSENESKEQDPGLGGLIIGGLLLAILGWVIFEGVFFILNWKPATSSVRFFVILGVIELLVVLGMFTDDD